MKGKEEVEEQQQRQPRASTRKEITKNQRQTGRVSQTMGRQRNNPQMKGKEEVSETMLNERGKSTIRY